MAIFTGIAGLIGGAVSAVSGFIGTLGAVGSFLLRTAVGIGLNLLAQAIAGKPKDPTFSINGTLQAGGDIPRSFIVGRTMTAGSLVWVNTWGKDGDTPNAYLTQVIALSDLPIKGVDEFWVNGENTGMDMSELVTSEGDGNATGLKASIIVKAFFEILWGRHKDLIQYLPGGIAPTSLPAFTTAVNSSGHLDKFEDRFGGDTSVAVAGPFNLLDLLSSVIVQLGGTPKQSSQASDLGVPVKAYRKDGTDHMWVRFYDGTQTGTDPLLVGKASNNQRQWQPSRIGKGVAYAVITCRNKKNMFSGIPNFKFVVNGIPLYDPSKDSTVGGVGDHRWAEPETWGGDGDYLPAVQAYNLLRGIEYNGQWFYGLQGMTAARLPVANWIAQINKCRADDDKYQCSGEINIDAPLATALEAVLTTCQGRISEIGGVYNIYLGAPDTPVASFTDDDILSTEEQSFTPFFGLADTINGIAATYPDPDDGWNMKAAPPLYRTDLEVLAGNRRLMADVEMTFVPNAEQVQRLMKSALLEGQRARRHTLVLPPAYWPYAVPGAILSWTSERNGYVNKLFRVDGAVDRANLDVMIDITEVDPADYDWDPDTDYRPPVDGTIGVIRPPPQPLIGWQVFPATIGQAGKELPSIRVAYPGQLDDVRAVRVQARLAGETEPFFDGEVPYGDPLTNEPQASVILGGTFTPNTDHQVRGILVPYGDRETEWSEWLPVKTPDVWISDVYDVDLDMLAGDVKGYLDWVGSGVREIERRLEEFDLWMADQDFGNAYDRQRIRQQLTATFDNARAEWKYDVNVVAAENHALAQRVESLDAEVFDPETGLPAVAGAVDALSVEVAEIDGEMTAVAEAVTSLSASTTPGDVTEANFRMQAVAGPTGYSRIGAQTRQGGTGAWRGAAWFLDTPNNPAEPTRFVVDAQQMVFGDMSSGSYINPLIYSGGVWRMNVANIGTVTAGVIESPDGKFKITLHEGKIEWWD